MQSPGEGEIATLFSGKFASLAENSSKPSKEKTSGLLNIFSTSWYKIPKFLAAFKDVAWKVLHTELKSEVF